jgi:hypothetical protein
MRKFNRSEAFVSKTIIYRLLHVMFMTITIMLMESLDFYPMQQQPLNHQDISVTDEQA